MCSFKLVLTRTNLTAIPAFDTPLLAFKFRSGLKPQIAQQLHTVPQWVHPVQSMNQIRNRTTALKARGPRELVT